MSDDVVVFARLAIAARANAYSGERTKARVLAPKAAGISRIDLLARLRRYHKTDWTEARLTAVLAELVARGAMRKSGGGGWCSSDWEAMAAVAHSRAPKSD